MQELQANQTSVKISQVTLYFSQYDILKSFIKYCSATPYDYLNSSRACANIPF